MPLQNADPRSFLQLPHTVHNFCRNIPTKRNTAKSSDTASDLLIGISLKTLPAKIPDRRTINVRNPTRCTPVFRPGRRIGSQVSAFGCPHTINAPGSLQPTCRVRYTPHLLGCQRFSIPAENPLSSRQPNHPFRKRPPPAHNLPGRKKWLLRTAPPALPPSAPDSNCIASCETIFQQAGAFQSFRLLFSPYHLSANTAERSSIRSISSSVTLFLRAAQSSAWHSRNQNKTTVPKSGHPHRKTPALQTPDRHTVPNNHRLPIRFLSVFYFMLRRGCTRLARFFKFP